MDKIRSLIIKLINENFKILVESEFYDNGKNIPQGIRNWVKSTFGSEVPKYKIIQGEPEVQINMPWHQSDYETYQFFKLENNNATPVGNQVTRSGNESDSVQGHLDGESKEGKVKVPEGFVLVCYGSYPKRVEIYTGNNVQHFLPNKEQSADLNSTELIILASAKALKSFARPKFKDDAYLNLIQKGLLKPNRSITVDGLNVLLDPETKEKIENAKKLYYQQTGRYLSF